MGLKLKARGTVFSGEPGSSCQSSLYPGVSVLPDGRCLVTFRTAAFREARKGQTVRMCISCDSGATWSEPHVFFPEAPDIDGQSGEFFSMYTTPAGGSEVLGLILRVDTSHPEHPYYNPETNGIVDHKLYFTRSHDDGSSWETPSILSGMPVSRPTAPTAPLLMLPGGEIGCQFEVHKAHQEIGPKYFEGAMIFSSDDGKTWKDYSVVSNDPEQRIFWWDQRINRLDDRLLALFWTYDDRESKYLNIHASLSTDNGRTWGVHYDTGVPGQPSQPVLLKDGSIAMAYVDRTGSPAIRVRQSFDGGVTWPAGTEVTVFDSEQAKQDKEKTSLSDMWTEMYQFSVGFPSIAVMPDGNLMVCYYSGPDTDSTAIRWAIIAVS